MQEGVGRCHTRQPWLNKAMEIVNKYLLVGVLPAEDNVIESAKEWSQGVVLYGGAKEVLQHLLATAETMREP